MNVILVVRVLPKATPMEWSQAVVTSYVEPSLGDVNLVAQVITTDMRVPDGSAILGFANEMGAITQITSLDEIVGIFGFDSEEIEVKRKLHDTMKELVGVQM